MAAGQARALTDWDAAAMGVIAAAGDTMLLLLSVSSTIAPVTDAMHLMVLHEI